METRELTCIGCPMGCQITVELDENGVRSISGNTCKVGETYAGNEVLHPMRTVTSTVRVKDGELPAVSVKTNREVPKDRIFAVMKALGGVTVQAPVRIGDVVLADVCGTGADVTATKTVERTADR